VEWFLMSYWEVGDFRRERLGGWGRWPLGTPMSVTPSHAQWPRRQLLLTCSYYPSSDDKCVYRRQTVKLVSFCLLCFIQAHTLMVSVRVGTEREREWLGMNVRGRAP
jgi:hypothetical protein